MHSSRMRTACLLPVSPSMHSYRGDVPGQGVPGPRGVGPGGYLVLGVYLVPGDTLSGGLPGPRGVPGPGGYLAPGGYLPRYSPRVNRMTDRCKNITLPQLRLRAVKMVAEHISKLFSSPRYKKL